MNIIIYNINSFGGNYEYSKYISEAYLKSTDVNSCKLLMPSNADVNAPNVLKILHSDIPKLKNKIYRKLHFLYRSFLNPITLYKFLKSQSSSVVIFNDYDQLTSMFWAPFIRRLKKKHFFAVILHDPDRDEYLFTKYLSEYTMKQVTSIMDVSFFHGYLPDKPYYAHNSLKVKIPHGIYNDQFVDEDYFLHLKDLCNGNHLIGILGNIRSEKNYEIIIDALCKLPDVKLLIAGNPANSSVSIEYYKTYALKAGVQNQILWQTDYLSQAKFNAAIKACDVIMLFYKSTFTSQSGVLNTIAPFCKKLVISDAESSLKQCVTQYKLGEVVPNDNLSELVLTLRRLLSSEDSNLRQNWAKYIEDSSWDKHVAIAIEQYKILRNEV